MIRPATAADAPAIARLIRALADYEHLSHAVALDDGQLREHLFGPRPFAEALLAEDAGAVVGYALFFPTYSTFLGRPGLYLEDLFVEPAHRGRGHGKALLAAVARLAVERGWPAAGMVGAGLERASDLLLPFGGGGPCGWVDGVSPDGGVAGRGRWPRRVNRVIGERLATPLARHGDQTRPRAGGRDAQSTQETEATRGGF